MLAGLGSQITTDKACSPCNGLLNQLVDTPFLNDWFVAMERTRRGLRDRRRGARRSRRASPPRQRVTLQDGTPAKVDFSSPELIPAQLREGPGGPVVFGGSASQRERLAVRYRVVTSERGRTREAEEGPTGGTLQMGLSISTTIWLRFAARATLGSLSLLGWSDEWLDGPQAALLRGFVFDERPTKDGQPLCWRPRRAPSWLATIVRNDEHRLVFYPGPDGRAALHILLFGNQWAGVLVDPECQPTPNAAWRIPIDRAIERGDFFSVSTEVYAASRPV